MERHEVLEMMAALKLAGMRDAFDEVLADGLKRQHPMQRIIGELLKAEIADKQARSIKYQMSGAKLPLAKELAEQCAGVENRDKHQGGKRQHQHLGANAFAPRVGNQRPPRRGKPERRMIERHPQRAADDVEQALAPSVAVLNRHPASDQQHDRNRDYRPVGIRRGRIGGAGGDARHGKSIAARPVISLQLFVRDGWRYGESIYDPIHCCPVN